MEIAVTAVFYRPSRRFATVVLTYPYRHSRIPLPSFPRKRESRTVLPYTAAVLAGNRRIPACAGMTVGRAGMTVCDGGRLGFPLTREGR